MNINKLGKTHMIFDLLTKRFHVFFQLFYIFSNNIAGNGSVSIGQTKHFHDFFL